MPDTSQCTNVPPGASGSSHNKTSSAVPSGGVDHSNAGDTLPPSFEQRAGNSAPSLNAGDRRSITAPGSPPPEPSPYGPPARSVLAPGLVAVTSSPVCSVTHGTGSALSRGKSSVDNAASTSLRVG